MSFVGLFALNCGDGGVEEEQEEQEEERFNQVRSGEGYISFRNSGKGRREEKEQRV